MESKTQVLASQKLSSSLEVEHKTRAPVIITGDVEFFFNRIY